MVLRNQREEEAVDAVTATGTASAAGSSSLSASSPSSIVSIPLQSYETIQRRRQRQRQRRRRQQERRPDEENEEEARTQSRRTPQIERPTFSRHDPRFLQLPAAAVAVAGLYQGYGTVRTVGRTPFSYSSLIIIRSTVLVRTMLICGVGHPNDNDKR
jgi:hypothetical protein